MKKLLLLLIAIAWTSSSCEKDDICSLDTDTTPRLVIEFFDRTIPTNPKTVTNLSIQADGASEAILFNGVSKILLPLKTTADVVNYTFTLNAGSTDPATIDTDNLQIKYVKSDIFISRACGFKTIFILGPTNPFTLTDPVGPDPENLWIKNITLNQAAILTEDETHLKILF